MMMRRSAYTEVPTPHASSVKCNELVEARNNKIYIPKITIYKSNQSLHGRHLHSIGIKLHMCYT
jgi:ribosomal protein L35AE/L33A